jgi:hypothetical protein
MQESERLMATQLAALNSYVCRFNLLVVKKPFLSFATFSQLRRGEGATGIQWTDQPPRQHADMHLLQRTVLLDVLLQRQRSEPFPNPFEFINHHTIDASVLTESFNSPQ